MNNHRIWHVIAFILLFSLIGVAGASAAQDEPRLAYYATHAEPILDWDPSVEFGNGIIVLSNVYETLLRYLPEQDRLAPLLATEYARSDDGLTWTFKIRRGVKFHDGTELNAEAVKFSIERTIRLGKGAAYIWLPVKAIKTPDEYTVVFELNFPSPLDHIVSSGYGAFIVSPKSVKDKPDDWLSRGHAVGTGPYKLRSFKMGDEVILSANKDYWGGWGKNRFDLLVFKKIAEPSSRRQMVEKGEADFVSELPVEDVDALKKNPKVQVRTSPSFQNLLLMLNTAKKPLSDKLVRQALSYAFPYDKVVKYAAGGYARQSRGVVPFGHWGHDESLFRYSTDLDKARELLSRAGYPKGGLKLLLTYTTGDEAQKKMAELFKSELAKIKVDLEVRGMPFASQWEMAKNTDPEKRQDLFAFYWWPDYASPYSWLFNLYHTQENISFNTAYWSSPDFDKLIDRANELTGTNKEEAVKLFVEAQKQLVEEAVTIYVYDKQSVEIMSDSFAGHVNNPIYNYVIFFHDAYRK